MPEVIICSKKARKIAFLNDDNSTGDLNDLPGIDSHILKVFGN